MLRVNVYGLRHITERLLATGRLADGASIVNIASLAGMAWERHLDRIAELDAGLDFEAGIAVAKAYERGGPAAYVLSKEWVVAYTQRLSGQLLPQRIRVNSVSPGPVLTPLFPYFEADAGAEQMAWMNEQVGRAAEPDDEAPPSRGCSSATAPGSTASTCPSTVACRPGCASAGPTPRRRPSHGPAAARPDGSPLTSIGAAVGRG